MSIIMARPVRLAAILGISALALAGCTSDRPAGAAAEAPADIVSVSDAWVKAADEGMSAAFGVIANAGEEDVTVVSVSSAASSELELHETVGDGSGSMQMREVDGGFVIPAGGDLALEPGGHHIMLMDLVEPLLAGDEVSFTLTFADDSTYEFSAPVKDYAGANEEYVDESHTDMGH